MFAILYKSHKGYLSRYLYSQSLLWSSNYRLGKKKLKRTKEQKKKKKKEKFSRLRSTYNSEPKFCWLCCRVDQAASFCMSTMYGVHRIPVFLAKYWKTERIDKKEGKKVILPIVRSSFLFRSIYRKYVKAGYFLAWTSLRMCIAPWFKIQGQLRTYGTT